MFTNTNEHATRATILRRKQLTDVVFVFDSQVISTTMTTRVFGIIGANGSGKDTIAKFLIDNHGFKKVRASNQRLPCDRGLKRPLVALRRCLSRSR